MSSLPTRPASCASGALVVVAEESTPDPAPEEQTEEVSGLDEKTQRQIEKLRQENAGLRRGNTEKEAALAAKANELDEYRRATESETERQMREAREEGRREERERLEAVISSARRALVQAEARSLAAGRFANPDMAVRLIEFDGIADIEDEGERRKLMTAQYDAILENDPYLAPANRQKPSLVTQGARSPGRETVRVPGRTWAQPKD